MNNKNQSSIISLVLLLIIVVIGLLWFKPNWDKVRALQVTEKARQETLNTTQKTLDDLKLAQEEIAGSSEIDQEMVLTSIPENFNQDLLINDLNSIAKDTNVNIGSVSFSAPTTSSETIKRATINMSLTGGNDELIRFLKGIENNSRKITVKSITVQYGQIEEITRINFNLSMETYFQNAL